MMYKTMKFMNRPSLAWPDHFFPFFFGVVEKRIWTSSQAPLILAPLDVLILFDVIITYVHSRKLYKFN